MISTIPSDVLGYINRHGNRLILLIWLFEGVFLTTALLENSIPLFTPTIAVIQLSFIPGLLLCLLLRVHESVQFSKLFVFSVGVSLVLSMLVALTVNEVFPMLGIPQPLSRVPLSIGHFGLVISLLSMVSFYPVDTVDFIPNKEYKKNSTVLLLLSLPVTAVVVSYLLREHHVNYGVILFLILIALLPLVAIYQDKKYYALIVWTASLSLLLANSLSYNFIGPGGALESTVIRGVIVRGVWAPEVAVQREYNLRLQLLHPAYVTLARVPLHDSFRIINPILISIVPLTLFLSFQKWFSGKIAMLSAFYFMFAHQFYRILIANTRTSTAILFFSLFLLLLASEELSNTPWEALLMIFSLGLIFSHFGTGHLYLFAVIGVVSFRYAGTVYHFLIKRHRPNQKNRITIYFGVLLFVFIIFWDSFISGNLLAIIKPLERLVTSLVELNFYSESTDASQDLAGKKDATMVAIRYLYLLSIGFISLGILRTGIRFLSFRDVDMEFFGGSLTLFSIIALGASPFAASFNFSRTYIIVLVLLAPFVVYGFQSMVEFLFYVIPDGGVGFQSVDVFPVFLLVFFLFTSGIVSATLTHENSTNVIVDKPRIIEDGSPKMQYKLFRDDPTHCDQQATTWLWKMRGEESTIYKGNPPHTHEFALSIPVNKKARVLKTLNVEMVRKKSDPWKTGDYFFVSKFTHESNLIVLSNPNTFDRGFRRRPKVHMDELSPLVTDENLIYSGGECTIYTSN